MGRLAWYAGVSTALAGGVIISAFNQRANFYSACVYLSQSNLCLMILINLILFIYGSFMYGLQRLCYGALRPIEIEQMTEKAWFAVTETCLAMTIFREEVGAWFLVMFVALLTGKVWGWIGDGRVEILEQQPPANPRLFHIRLSISLTMSILYDLWMMRYTINTVIQQARPNMMVMFLFEFAILTTCSLATGFRYWISLIEAKVVKTQTQERLVERRREVREERAEILRQREAAATAAAEGGEAADATQNAPLPSEDDVDEMDIEVPGWEAKGQWILTLDLCSDFIKLAIYVTFFVILFMFHGLPIHIVRDLFLTARSFTKRLAAFLRYRRATQDMNSRYEDATVEDIQREDTCIICREDMRPWSVTNPQAPPAGPGVPAPARPGGHTVNERSRPKKLPCGHILHLGCLKSWLERQQVCPTCRAPVVDTPPGQAARAAGNNANPAGQGAQPPVPGQQDGPGAPPPQNGRGAGRGMRMLNFGPLRVGFGQANLQDFANGLGGPQANQENGARMYGLELGFPRRAQHQTQAQGGDNLTGTTQDRLQQIEQEIVAEIRNLQITQQELQLVQLLQTELSRLRLRQNGGADPLAGNNNNMQMPQMPQLAPLGTRHVQNTAFYPQMQRHGVRPNTSAIPSGSAELPPGVAIPEGWSLLPLQRLDGLGATQIGQVPLPGPGGNVGSAPTATTQPATISPMGANSNNNLTPTPTINPDNHSQTSSTDSSDGNAIHTPPSVAAGESSALNMAANTPFPTATAQIANSMSNTPTSASIASSSTANPHPSGSSSTQLPNWGGSSQLFSNPGPGNMSSHAIATPASTSTTTMPPPPTPSFAEGQAQEQGQHVSSDTSDANAHMATAASASGSATSEIGETSGARDEDVKGKGKAKAATVEDTIDEAEGS